MRVCVIGGGGYVGSKLVPSLLNDGHEVTVLDTFWFGNHLSPHQRLRCIVGDVRKHGDVSWAISDNDAVIHLACISNDPSFDLDPKLGKDINLTAFPQLLKSLKKKKIKRFIYASSSSVYGVKEEEHVTEDLSCEPLTDYSKYKLECEKMLRLADLPDTTWTIIRPATVCGFAPRLRLDLIVNALTIDGLTKHKITIHGGDQIRPNLNIKDMVLAYQRVLGADERIVHKKTYNVGGINNRVDLIAEKVQKTLSDIDVKIVREPVIDKRSYKIDSSKIKRELDFSPLYTIDDAIRSIEDAYYKAMIPEPSSSVYYNVKVLKELK